MAADSFPRTKGDPLKTFSAKHRETLERYPFLKWTAWIKVHVIGDTPKWRARIFHPESDWKYRHCTSTEMKVLRTKDRSKMHLKYDANFELRCEPG